jgi:DNA polymerase-3 subunit delta'
MSFRAPLGNAPAVARLSASARAGTFPHALLLSGPPSVGKTTLAVALAELLVATEAWPGGVGSHPDVWIEDGPAEHIRIDRVRAGGRDADAPTLQDFLSLRTYSGGAHVAIVGRADRLTIEAANCILRTVEEPPPATHILLCAAHPERLPDTLVSRCQVIHMAPVGRAELVEWLTSGHAIDPEAAATAAVLFGGRPGRALSLALDPSMLQTELDALDHFLGAAGSGPVGAIRAADALAPATSAEGRERSLIQLAVWSEFLRDALCHAVGAPELAPWTGRAAALERWATLPPWRLRAMLDRCMTAADELERNAHPKLCYEVLFLDIFARHPAPPGAEEPAVSAGARPPAAQPQPSGRQE